MPVSIPNPRASRKARIEIIPLIDIMFFLLATFVMVSLSMVKNEGVPVRLPVATSGSPQERRDTASISIREDGALFFNKEPVLLTELPARLAAFQSVTAEPRVFINGDARADFQYVVGVLDEVRRRGITRIAIETTRTTPSSP
jgi:biopolymer transport protein ExbD